MQAVKVVYEGRVQGVGFRYNVKSLAQGFDVSGWVKNCADGTVELVAQGEKDEVDDFIQCIQESHLTGFIKKATPTKIEVQTDLRGFSIEG